MGKPELRECPFCGADAYFLDEEPGNFMVCCRDCSATSVVTASRAEAVNAWNRRITPPAVPGPMSRLSDIPEVRRWFSNVIYAFVHDVDSAEPTEGEITGELDALEALLGASVSSRNGTETCNFGVEGCKRHHACATFPEAVWRAWWECEEAKLDGQPRK